MLNLDISPLPFAWKEKHFKKNIEPFFRSCLDLISSEPGLKIKKLCYESNKGENYFRFCVSDNIALLYIAKSSSKEILFEARRDGE